MLPNLIGENIDLMLLLHSGTDSLDDLRESIFDVRTTILDIDAIHIRVASEFFVETGWGEYHLHPVVLGEN